MSRPLQFRGRWPLWPLLFLLPVGFALSYSAWFFLALSPLQQLYFAPYLGTSFLQQAKRPMSVPLLWMSGPKRAPQLAEERDLIPVENGTALPFALSADARARGWTGLARVNRKLAPKAASSLYREQFFAGQNIFRLFLTPVCGMLLFGLGYIALREKFGAQSKHEERHGRRTKGPEPASALKFLPGRNADGIRLKLRGPLRGSFRIPKRLESSHILLMGDTGSGKSNAIRQMLRQVERRGESAIVYDPAGEFVQEFYRPERGDYILNPLDERCPFWNLHSELTGRGIEDALAAAMLPERQFESGFFTDAPRRVLSALLRRTGSLASLLEWMADPSEIEKRLAGTPQAVFLDRKAGPQRAGVLASLNLIADSLELLPKSGDDRDWFTTGKWKFERTRWVFLTSSPAVRERVLPLHSAWLDLLILRMMEPCANPAKPVWFVLDELASLNKLPQLHTAVTENRKYGNPVVLGFQGRSQLEKRYGQDAEAMLSQPATKIFFKTSEPRAAKWISETLGEVEVERLKESRTPGFLRDRKSFAMEIATKPLVMASEIAGLEPLRAFIKQENRVVPVRFAFSPKRSRQPEFIARKMEVSEPKPMPEKGSGVQADPRVGQQEAGAVTSHSNQEQTSPPPVVAEQTSLLPEGHLMEEGQSEPRKPAFRKGGGTLRPWKPLD